MSGKSDFGSILDFWESRSPADGEDVLKEKGDLAPQGSRRAGIAQLRRLPPQETLDLHGLTAEEAVARTKGFLCASRAAALDKVAIITGKGLHSQGGDPVVRTAVLRCLQNNTMVSEVQKPSERWGGGGAVWVILKRGQER